MSGLSDHLEPFRDICGLSYQIAYLSMIDQICSLAGLRVLEVGGSNLPRKLVFEGLKAKQWICIDDVTTFSPHSHRPENDLLYEHYRDAKYFEHSDPVEDILAEDYAIIDGDASDLRILDHFDVVISIAAFEHIHRFSTMLSRVHASLKKNGQLLSLFQPIWSGVNGHHLVGIVDAKGDKYGMGGWDIVPPWGHLLFTPPLLYKILRTRTDAKCADDIIYAVYNSTMLNRLFFDDYVDYMNDSPFRLHRVDAMGKCHVPDAVLEQLATLYPGRTCFDANTVLIHAAK
jgi:hypothetical protein